MSNLSATRATPELDHAGGTTPTRTGFGTRLRDLIAQQTQTAGMVLFLVILLCVARVVYPGFLEPANLRNVLSQNAPIGLIAVGMTFVMIGGGFDLSVGAIVALTSVCFAKFALAFPLSQAVVAALLLGAALGLINGTLVTRLNLNPFIATLATASIFSGAAYVVSDSQPILVGVEGFQTVGQDAFLGLPISVWILAFMFLAGGLVLAYSVYGHLLYAVGGNKEAARLAGVRTDLNQSASYVIVGIMSALAGVVLTSRLGVGQADVGSALTLNAITIVVIGGTSLFGGEGAMWRTAVGLLLIGVITNVADSKGWSGNVQDIVKGSVLLVAVGLDVLSRRVRAGRPGRLRAAANVSPGRR